MPTQADMMYNIRNTVEESYAEIKRLHEVIAEQQEKCPHPDAIREYGSDTGNYDPSEDKYWCTFECPHCKKRWNVDSNHPDYRQSMYTYGTAEGIVDA